METCKHCNEESEYTLFDVNGEPICESCEQNAWNHHQSVFVCEDGESKKFIWCEEMGWRSAEYFEQEEPSGVETWKYVRTDGWRGYYAPILKDGYTDIASGWVTGRYDDVRYKHTFNDLYDRIIEGEIDCPFRVIFAFGLTSNVFSVTGDVIVRESDAEKFGEWLIAEAGLENGIDDLQSALN